MALFRAFSKIWPLQHRSFWYIIYVNLFWRFTISLDIWFYFSKCSELCMNLWRCIQFDPDYGMGYFSTSGRDLKTGSWLFCHETDYQILPWVIKKWFRVDWVAFRYSWNRKYWWKPEVFVNFNLWLHICNKYIIWLQILLLIHCN